MPLKVIFLALFSFMLSFQSLASNRCADGFKEPYFYHGRLFFLEQQAKLTFDWSIQQMIKKGNLAQAARRAEERGFRDLSYLINKTLKEILESSPIKPGYPKRLEIRGVEMYLVEFTSGIRATFKPEKDSLARDNVQDFYRHNPMLEMAAYKLARIFGLDAIPMTVIRTINGLRGSIQAEVRETGRPQNSIINPKEGKAHPQLVSAVADLFIFDLIIRNIERSDMNIIFEGRKVWGYENGVSFIPEANKQVSRPLDQMWIDSVSLSFSAGLKATTPEMIRHQLDGLMKPQLIEEAVVRHRQVLEALPESPVGRR